MQTEVRVNVVNPIDCSYTLSGSGPAIFMVHGIGSRKATWDGLLSDLEPHFTCIRYDLRGHGESTVTDLPFGLDELVEDLEALREKLGIERGHVIGHSLGGMIGPAYARKYPDRVLSLGLLSTAAGRTADDSAKVNAVVQAMEDKGIEPVLKTLIERWYTDEFIAACPDAIEARIKQVVDTPVDVFLNVFRIYANTEMGPWLHEIEKPSLVLTGENDGGCNPRLNRFIHEQMLNSELVILPKLKHSILIEAPDVVAPVVREFLIKQES